MCALGNTRDAKSGGVDHQVVVVESRDGYVPGFLLSTMLRGLLLIMRNMNDSENMRASPSFILDS